MRDRLDGRADSLQVSVRKVRTPQGRTVANGDPARRNPKRRDRATETIQQGFVPEMVKRCGPQGLKVRAHQRRGDAAAEVTPVRCKAKQKAQAERKLSEDPARRAFGLAAVARPKFCSHAASNRRSREMTISVGETPQNPAYRPVPHLYQLYRLTSQLW